MDLLGGFLFMGNHRMLLPVCAERECQDLLTKIQPRSSKCPLRYRTAERKGYAISERGAGGDERSAPGDTGPFVDCFLSLSGDTPKCLTQWNLWTSGANIFELASLTFAFCTLTISWAFQHKSTRMNDQKTIGLSRWVGRNSLVFEVFCIKGWCQSTICWLLSWSGVTPKRVA